MNHRSIDGQRKKQPSHTIRLMTGWIFCCFMGDAALAVNPCIHENDDSKRLACYDLMFSEPPETANQKDASSTVTAPSNIARVPEPAAAAQEQSHSNISRFWELDPKDKGGNFVVKTYLPNFLLPVHYTSSINRAPHSPTQPATKKYAGLQHHEAKLQISLRTKIADDVLIPDANLWFAYTQRSLWQVWNHEDSAPFRSTDYQPEAIYNISVPEKLGTLPHGWQLRLIQLGIAHQSNGQSDPFSRSWNYFYAGAGLEKGNLSIMYRFRQRLNEDHNDDNPDLIRYIGRNEFVLNWLAGRSTVSLTWKTPLTHLGRGSVQFDLTYPVFANNPDGLRWYLQAFSGYGETLLDYNHRQNRIGAGLTLFQF